MPECPLIGCRSSSLCWIDLDSKLRAKEALATIVNLTQGTKSIREYGVEFELNIERLDSSDEATLIQFFIWGLHRDIAERVSITHPASLFVVVVGGGLVICKIAYRNFFIWQKFFY